MAAQNCMVTFRITAAISAGEAVHLVGSAPSTALAVPLVTNQECYPLWFTPRPVILPVGTPLQYKYIVVADGRLQRWEAIEGNRVINPRGKELIVEDALDSQPHTHARTHTHTHTHTHAQASGDAHAHSHGLSITSRPEPDAAATARSASDAAGLSPGTSPCSSEDGHTHTHTHTHADGEGEAVVVRSRGDLSSVPGQILAQARAAGVDVSGVRGDAPPPSLHRPSASTRTAEAAEQRGEAGAETPLSADGSSPVTLAASPVQPADMKQAGPSATDAPRAETLTESDGVLIVQYRLPVRLERIAVSDSSHADGASPSVAGERVEWRATWDDEELLSVKGAVGANWANMRVKWIGTPPIRIAPADEEAVQRALEALHCIPVFLPAAVQEAFYDGYCRDTLWPVFHNVIDVYGALPTRWWKREQQTDRWKSYMDANTKFASTVVENFHEGDLVWIHDYPLLLVPMMLARRHIAPVGLFLHIPFPSSEVFRSLSFREELLRGMLNAEHIGFHLFEYARHFLTSCRRILGLTHSSRRGGCLAIDYQGREVTLSVSHVGIEPEFLRGQFAGNPGIMHEALQWRRRFPGCTILSGIDGVERLKGVPIKLAAWESFLATHPEWRGRAVLVQICLLDMVRPGDTQELTQNEIQQQVERINRAFGRPGLPAVYLEVRDTAPQVPARLALWAATDVMINTSIRDGLNLHPFEYLQVRGSGDCVTAGVQAAGANASVRADGDVTDSVNELSQIRALADAPPGSLILSEFSGGARVLPGALRVNPWRLEEVVSAMEHALCMTGDEQATRVTSSLGFINGSTTSMWARRILIDLKAAYRRTGNRTYMGYGLGLGYRLTGFGSSFKPLNLDHVVAAYRKAKHRLIVCDYGGTLNVRDSSTTRKRAFELGLLGKDAAPPLTHETKRALKALTEDANNTVFIISGKDRDVLEQAFASLPHCGLAAEHGFFYRWGAPVCARPRAAEGEAGADAAGIVPDENIGGITPLSIMSNISEVGSRTPSAALPPTPALFGASGSALPNIRAASSGNGLPWETLGPTDRHDDWKLLAHGIMATYAARTNGVYILRKGSAVSWHYGDADPEFGSMQAKELQDHLQGVLAGYAVDVLSGQGYVEVRPKGVNKGFVLAHIVDTLEGREPRSLNAVKPHRTGDLRHTDSFASNTTPEEATSVGSTSVSALAPSVGDQSAGAAPSRGVGRGLSPSLRGQPSPSMRTRIGSPLGRPASSPVDEATGLPSEPSLAQGLPSVVSLGSLTSPTPDKPASRRRRAPAGRGPEWTPRPLEFILVIGDDLADEEMFTTIHSYKKDRLAERRAVVAQLTSQQAAALLQAAGHTDDSPKSSAAESVAGAPKGPESGRWYDGGADTPASDVSAVTPAVMPAPRVSRFGVNILGNSSDSPAVPAAGKPAQPAGDVPRRDGEADAAAATPAGAAKSGPKAAPTFLFHEYTVTVGKKPSAAQHFLDDTQQVEDVLKTLARASVKFRTGGRSSADAAARHPPLHPSMTTGAAAGRVDPRLPLAQVAVTQAFQQRMRGGIAMMSLPANIDRLVMTVAPQSTGSSGGHTFVYPPASTPASTTTSSSTPSTGSVTAAPMVVIPSPHSTFPATPSGPAIAMSMSALSSMSTASRATVMSMPARNTTSASAPAPTPSGTARTASVRVGMPTALAGLYASSSRLHTLPTTLGRVPENAAAQPGGDEDADNLGGSADDLEPPGSDDEDDAEDEDDDVFDDDELVSPMRSSAERMRMSMSRLERRSSGGLAPGAIGAPAAPALGAQAPVPLAMMPPAVPGLSPGQVGFGVATVMPAAPDALAGAATAVPALLAGSQPLLRTGSSSSMSCGVSHQAAISSGLTQYFDRIAEGNAEDVPEF